MYSLVAIVCSYNRCNALSVQWYKTNLAVIFLDAYHSLVGVAGRKPCGPVVCLNLIVVSRRRPRFNLPKSFPKYCTGVSSVFVLDQSSVNILPNSILFVVDRLSVELLCHRAVGIAELTRIGSALVGYFTSFNCWLGRGSLHDLL